MLNFLRTREWVIARRAILIIIVVIVAFAQYGGGFRGLFNRPNPKRDIEVTRVEFRTDVPAARPIWIIGFRNTSHTFAYDAIQLEASYFDADGKFLQKDKLV